MYSQKCAKDFRYEARTALSGNWWLAIGTTIVASILGLCTITSTVGSISSNSDSSAAVNDPAVMAVMLLVSSISFIYNSQIFISIIIITSNNTQNYIFSVSFFEGTVNIVFSYIYAYFFFIL